MIVLVGMMAVGKSTVGRIIADECSYEFEDLDERVMKIDLFQRSPDQIINDDGEGVFRALEHRALQGWLQSNANPNRVLATGGGVVLQESNRELLKKSGARIVWLRAEIDTIRDRFQGDSGNPRPLLKTSESTNIHDKIHALLVARNPLYESFEGLEIHTDQLAPMDCARTIIEAYDLG